MSFPDVTVNKDGGVGEFIRSLAETARSEEDKKLKGDAALEKACSDGVKAACDAAGPSAVLTEKKRAEYVEAKDRLVTVISGRATQVVKDPKAIKVEKDGRSRSAPLSEADKGALVEVINDPVLRQECPDPAKPSEQPNAQACDVITVAGEVYARSVKRDQSSPVPSQKTIPAGISKFVETPGLADATLRATKILTSSRL